MRLVCWSTRYVFKYILEKKAFCSILKKCWASLPTDRAVIYRMQNGFDHNQVSICVVVQKMVFPVAWGFYLLPIRLLRIGRCCQSMPALDLARR
ncbi:PEP/pyruvate-binding domain-containing protein [Bacillus cereus]